MSEEEEMARIDELLSSTSAQGGLSLTSDSTDNSTLTITNDTPNWTPYTQASPSPNHQGTYIINEYSNWLNSNGAQLRDVTPITERKLGIRNNKVIWEEVDDRRKPIGSNTYNFFKSLKLIK